MAFLNKYFSYNNLFKLQSKIDNEIVENRLSVLFDSNFIFLSFIN